MWEEEGEEYAMKVRKKAKEIKTGGDDENEWRRERKYNNRGEQQERKTESEKEKRKE